ncbi:MAG TPA: class I SAM-dependent methyltransferase [Polyangiaceae bacterium]|nr:class I SAM-dependent methyltransferase [Polyangiaceae bacterium]
MADEYDRHPYTQHAYAETHPCRVGAVARLSGWEPPEIARARALELGCGRGGNLLPMAAGLRETTFLGVDRSERQIAEAERVAAGVGLANVTFVRSTFEDLDLAEGSFDYVVCHGVFSWIARDARGVLLEKIGRWLAPGGVAYVSFNALPGWYERLAARDWLRFASAALGALPETASRSIRWLSAQVSPERTDYRRRLDEVARRLEETDAAYARHEYLTDRHFPVLVQAFLDEARAAGLAYLGDAIPATTALELLPDEVQRRAASLAEADAQQLVDFVRCTAFRRALLVRGDEARARGWQSPRRLDPSAIQSMWVASRLRPREKRTDAAPLEAFEDGSQTVQISDDVVRRALHELARISPDTVSFEVLAEQVFSGSAARSPSSVSGLAQELFDLWLATGAIDLLLAPFCLSRAAGERPLACSLARWQATHGGVVTNRLHQEVQVPDAIVRWVLARLDGSRSRRELAAEARNLQGAAGAWGEGELEQLVAASVARLSACGLIVPSTKDRPRR